MAHLLTPIIPAVAIPPRSKKMTYLPSLDFHGVQQSCHRGEEQVPQLHHRRTLALGIAGLFLGLKAGDRSANAAARRPPPPPPEEKKDPNVSGVMAKVLASKKRKEAMKESMAKLREKGKPIKEPSE